MCSCKKTCFTDVKYLYIFFQVKIIGWRNHVRIMKNWRNFKTPSIFNFYDWQLKHLKTHFSFLCFYFLWVTPKSNFSPNKLGSESEKQGNWIVIKYSLKKVLKYQRLKTLEKLKQCISFSKFLQNVFPPISAGNCFTQQTIIRSVIFTF